MMSDGSALYALAAFTVVAAATGPLIGFLRSWRLIDVPNERSSHLAPTPTGGGIVIVLAVLPLWSLSTPGGAFYLLIPAAGLAVLSLWDDFKGLGAPARLAGHFVAVAAVLYADPALAGAAARILPAPAAITVTALAWVWFINLFNFMDGVDGIAGVETLTIGLGVALLAVAGGIGQDLAGAGLITGAATLGFLIWNWHPARIFMGDVGSVPLGFLLGWLLLSLAAEGAWAAALILPGYYLADATITLIHRAMRGEAVWRAHRSHFYQRSAQNGLGHHEVSGMVLICNAALILLAFASMSGPVWACIALAAAAVGGLLLLFSGAGGKS
ncbi:MAG: glycosyltransferase family 4 protein [Rhodospirillaceae bacterium]